jgi:hypothetical protein
MAFKLVPVPKDESWACLPCGMNMDRDVDAVMLLKEGEPGKRGVVSTGLCGNHAEVMDIDDLREAQRKFASLG